MLTSTKIRKLVAPCLHLVIRLGMCSACVVLVSAQGEASPCARLKSRLDAWVADRVDVLVKAAGRAYENDDAIPAYSRVLDGIAGTIRRCWLIEDDDLLSRHRVFVDYIQTISLDRDPDHELGFLVSDKQYFAETYRYVQIPEFLLEQKFLRNVSRYETLNQAKSYLQQLNSSREPSAQLIFFSYKSRHLGTPDNDASYGRLLIVVPGNAAQGLPDKWVQFGVPDPQARTRVRNVSVVSAVSRTDGAFDAYFKDFYRTYRRDGSITLKGRWELGEGDDNCTQCHKSGVLPIFPVSGSVSAAEQGALLAVNERFLTYGSARFGGYLDLGKFGPGLGAATAADRQQRFGARFESTAAAKAMVCSSCHQPERLGALNWPMDRILINSYVTGGQMPLGHELKASERQELYAKLIQEYFAVDRDRPGILKSWLLGMTP